MRATTGALVVRLLAVHRRAALLFLALAATASCGPGAIPPAPTPDDPATVRVIVFMRDQSGTELWVDFQAAAGGGSGSTSGVTNGVGVACQVVPAGAAVAVVSIPGPTLRLPLYTAVVGDPDRVLWVASGPGGDLQHGEGRPDWGTVSPQCPGAAR
jgi:hypothetical protein